VSARVAALLVACFLARGCFFDAGRPWSGGPYSIRWIDDPSATTLVRQDQDGWRRELIDEQVFAVGWDGRYLVAKQHPARDKSVTAYFVLDSTRSDDRDPLAEVSGPLTAEEFARRKTALRLPEFTTVLASLE
jgi:hypothetical protein